MKKATIQDVAREAGVVPSTVSFVLNGSQNVTPKTRAAVMAAIEKLNYRPSSIAQALRRGKMMAIGIVTVGMSSAFYGEMIEGIDQGLRDTGYQTISASILPHTVVSDLVEMLIGRGVEAIILLDKFLPDEEILQFSLRVPIIALNCVIQGLEDHCISVDEIDGAYKATQYLIGLGHKRIVHVAGSQSHPSGTGRQQGYCDALREVGLPIDPDLIMPGDFNKESGYQAIETLLARSTDFSAVFFANDEMAYGGLLALYDHRIHVPDQVSIIGFDDQRFSSYTIPPLTTMHTPIRDIGQVSATAALTLLTGGKISMRTFQAELKIRRSTRPLT
jgi:LacI family transcriptional regulator